MRSGAARGEPRGLARARILWAIVEVVAERGYAAASVELVSARARVSRRTFAGLFSGLEDCLAAVFDLGLECMVALAREAFAGQESWRDGVRVALAAQLVFLDSEPLLARVWLVESLAAGGWALEHRERNLAVFREQVLASWPASEEWSSPPLAAEGVIASILGIVHAHIVTGGPGPLVGLLGPLMGLAARPYLSARAAAREVELGEQLAREIQAGEHDSTLPRADLGDLHATHPSSQHGPHRTGLFGVRREDPGPPRLSGDLHREVAVPAVLGNPSAYRARRCLLFLAEHPGASNAEVAAGIGVAHQSQVSKLLRDLLAQGVVVKRSGGPGKRNAWHLSPHGEATHRNAERWSSNLSPSTPGDNLVSEPLRDKRVGGTSINS